MSRLRGDRDADAIIIGAGLGGLTAGAYLAKQGSKVLIFEQHRQPGGYFTSFKHKGYVFDGGIQGSEDAGMLLNMFRQLGLDKRIQFEKSRYGTCMGGFQAPVVDVPDIALIYQALARRFPADAAALEEISRDAVEFSRAVECFSAMPNPMLVPMWKVMAGFPVWAVRYGRYLKYFPRFFKYVSTPMEEYFESRITDPELMRILGMVSYRGTPASFGLSFVSYFLDYYYSRGGIQAIPDVMAAFIEEQGGRIEYKALVDEIVLEGKKACGVRLSDGRTFRAPFVINGGDARRAYTSMLPSSAVPARYRERLDSAELSESVFTVFLGLDIPGHELQTMGCHHLLVYPEDEPRERDWEKLPGMYGYSFVEISIPSLHDPSLAPSGKSVMIIQSMAEPETAAWGVVDGKPGPGYEKLKEECADLLIERAARIVPGLAEHIEVKLTATPYTHERYTLNAGGTTVGWTYHPHKGFFRHFMPMNGFLTPVKNLYQVGHWAMTPGGSPSAIISGRIVSLLVGARLRLGL